MDEALIKIGLPVTCSSCGEKAFVKPNTDYNGWYRRRLGRRSRWYCKRDAVYLKKMVDSINEKHNTTEVKPTTESTVDELYKLLD